MKAVSVYLKQKLKEQFAMFPLEIMPCTIFKRDSDNQIFLNGDILLNGS